jgi:hypothetical protein
LYQSENRSQVYRSPIIRFALKIDIASHKWRIGEDLRQALRLSGTARQTLELLDRHNDDCFLALAGHNLGSAFARPAKYFAKLSFGSLQLPRLR